MVEFMRAATHSAAPFDPGCAELCKDVLACLRSAQQSSSCRREIEAAIERIEARAEEVWRSSEADSWLDGLDADTRQLVASDNGPLYGELLAEASHVDAAAPKLFRAGGQDGRRTAVLRHRCAAG